MVRELYYFGVLVDLLDDLGLQEAEGKLEDVELSVLVVDGFVGLDSLNELPELDQVDLVALVDVTLRESELVDLAIDLLGSQLLALFHLVSEVDSLQVFRNQLVDLGVEVEIKQVIGFRNLE